MKLSSIFSFVISSSAVVTAVSSSSIRGKEPRELGQDIVDVCIIGAGPSGVQAAYTAEKNGLTTALFEKNSYVGGKTKSVFTNNPNFPYFMGAALYSTRKAASLDDLIDEFDIQLMDASNSEREIHFGPKLGDGSLASPIPPPSLEVLNAIQIYAGIRATLSPQLDNPSAFRLHNDDFLNVSVFDWLNTNGLMDLYGLIWFFCTTFGYGHPKDVPALYALKYLDVGTFIDLANISVPGFGMKFIEFQKLLEAMVGSLNGYVFLNTEITSVAYASKFNIVKYQVDGGSEESMKCGSTIIAFAPTSSAMKEFIPPTNKAVLTGLFDEVKTFSYYSILFKDTNGDFATGQKASYRVPEPTSPGLPDDPAENLLYFKQQPFLQSSVTAYYMSPTEKTEEEVMDEIFLGYGAKIQQTVTEDLVEDFNHWNYFPHVSQDSLENDFYKRFHEVQGYAHQYYVGGLFNFEMVQTNMDHSKTIMEEFFSGESV